jgi:hypothetical protein
MTATEKIQEEKIRILEKNINRLIVVIFAVGLMGFFFFLISIVFGLMLVRGV